MRTRSRARGEPPYRGAMRVRPLDLIAGLAAAGLVAAALSSCGHHHVAAVVLPSPMLTPGVTNPDVTQSNIHDTICVRGWTKTVRPPSTYTSALKARQLAEFSLRGPPSAYQEDHLISLELGGNSTDPRNLWPEPYPRASQVDQIENDLNAKVCSGALSLAQAQREEAALKHEHG
jgi:hypothetical protein